MKKHLIRTARNLLKEENFKDAANLFRQAGEYARAIECFLQSGDYRSAAETAIEQGKIDEAARYYLRGGFYRELADFYEARRDRAEAGKFYLRAGDYARAASQYEHIVAGFPEKLERAGQPFEHTDDEIRACRQAASAHARAGNYGRAVDLYERIHAFEEAAKYLMLIREYHRAGEAYKKSGRYLDAGHAFLQGNFFPEAALCFISADNFLHAAEAYMKAQDYVRAGDIYAQEQRFFEASEAYNRADKTDKAIKTLTFVTPDNPEYLKAVNLILALSYHKRYMTPVAKRFCETFVSSHCSLSDEKHFETVYSIAELMQKSEYSEEAHEILLKLEKHNSKQLAGLKQFDQSILDTTESKIDISEILKQDFKMEPQRKPTQQDQLEMDRTALMETNDNDVSTGVVSNTVKGKPARQTSSIELKPGKIFDERYLIKDNLGAGSMGSVYRAFDLELEEDIAIKILTMETRFSDKAVLRFKQEVRLARQINHPNVIRIFDFGDWNGLKYISMEFFEGYTLKEYIQENGFFNPDAGLKLVISICEGVSAAHHMGIIHRDIKSWNIMLSSPENVKILDFGIAKSLKMDGLTVEPAIIGTPEYMSPEAIQQKPVDARSDIYSLGIVMYEVFTGTVPFTGKNFLDVIHAHLEKTPPPIEQFNPDIPEDLADIIMTCIQRNPDDRYFSVAELSAELKMLRIA